MVIFFMIAKIYQSLIGYDEILKRIHLNYEYGNYLLIILSNILLKNLDMVG